MRRVCLRPVCGRLVSVQVGGASPLLGMRKGSSAGPPLGPSGRGDILPPLARSGPPLCGPPPPRCPRSGRGPRGRSRPASRSLHCRPRLRLRFARALPRRPRNRSGECGGGSSGRGNDPAGGGCPRLSRRRFPPSPRPVCARYARLVAGRVAVRLSPRRGARRVSREFRMPSPWEGIRISLALPLGAIIFGISILPSSDLLPELHAVGRGRYPAVAGADKLSACG